MWQNLKCLESLYSTFSVNCIYQFYSKMKATVQIKSDNRVIDSKQTQRMGVATRDSQFTNTSKGAPIVNLRHGGDKVLFSETDNDPSESNSLQGQPPSQLTGKMLETYNKREKYLTNLFNNAISGKTQVYSRVQKQLDEQADQEPILSGNESIKDTDEQTQGNIINQKSMASYGKMSLQMDPTVNSTLKINKHTTQQNIGAYQVAQIPSTVDIGQQRLGKMHSGKMNVQVGESNRNLMFSNKLSAQKQFKLQTQGHLVSENSDVLLNTPPPLAQNSFQVNIVRNNGGGANQDLPQEFQAFAKQKLGTGSGLRVPNTGDTTEGALISSNDYTQLVETPEVHKRRPRAQQVLLQSYNGKESTSFDMQASLTTSQYNTHRRQMNVAYRTHSKVGTSGPSNRQRYAVGGITARPEMISTYRRVNNGTISPLRNSGRYKNDGRRAKYVTQKPIEAARQTRLQDLNIPSERYLQKKRQLQSMRSGNMSPWSPVNKSVDFWGGKGNQNIQTEIEPAAQTTRVENTSKVFGEARKELMNMDATPTSGKNSVYLRGQKSPFAQQSVKKNENSSDYSEDKEDGDSKMIRVSLGPVGGSTKLMEQDAGMSPTADNSYQQSWVQMKPLNSNHALLDQTKSLHQIKKKKNQQLQDMIKKAELAIKQKRRTNEAMRKECVEKHKSLRAQLDVSTRVKDFQQAQQFNQETLQSVIRWDNPTESVETFRYSPRSIQNKSLDISGEDFTNSGMAATNQNLSSQMMNSQYTLLEKEAVTTKVHNLYNSLISGDMVTSKVNTLRQLETQRHLTTIANQSLQDLKQENRNLQKQITRSREMLKEHNLKEARRKLNAKMGFDDTSSRQDYQMLSAASMSQIGGGFQGQSARDMQRLEKINQTVEAILNSKVVFDCIQGVIKTFKEAFKNISRVTIFLINRQMQTFCINKKNRDHTSRFKSLSIDSAVVYAIFAEEKEYCTACWASLKDARTQIFSFHKISIPVFDRDQLLFTVQVELDPVREISISPSKANRKNNKSHKKNKLDGGRSQRTGSNTGTNSKMAAGEKSGERDGGSSARRSSRTAAWSHNDFTVCKIITMLAQSRLEIFNNHIQKVHKAKMAVRIREFVTKFIQLRTYKEVVASVKKDLPVLFGFRETGIFLHDENNQGLYAITLDEEQMKKEQLIDKAKFGFEHEYIVPENCICNFPLEMGITGFCFKADAVNFINDFKNSMMDKTKPPCGRTFGVGQAAFNRVAQLFLGHRMSAGYVYDSKIDNFLEVDKIQNYCFTSIQDEEFPGVTKPIGVLQFINRKGNDITQEDLLRIFHVRKLIGSTFKKVEHIMLTFQTMVGLVQAGDLTGNGKKMVSDLEAGFVENHPQTLGISLGFIERKLSEQGFALDAAHRDTTDLGSSLDKVRANIELHHWLKQDRERQAEAEQEDQK